jgi:hypothetical protein
VKQVTPAQVAELIPALDSPTFDLSVYQRTGLFVVRNLFPKETVARWQNAWAAFQAGTLANRKVGHNKVAVEEPMPAELEELYRSPQHLAIAREIYGPDVGMYHHRFVIKDKFSRDEIFLHHDYCYHFGYPEKASFFTPLSVAGRENGGLEFFIGTHQYGLLADAGEIDPAKFPAWPSVVPEVAPGDLIVMHSATWHRSGPHLGGPDRIVADTILQPAWDPSTIAIACGDQGPVNPIDRFTAGGHFRRSRTSRVRELTAEVESLKAELAQARQAKTP